MSEKTNPAAAPSIPQLAKLFLFLGAGSFSGAMLPLMEIAVVRRRQWLTSSQFAEAVGLAEIAPGPVAVKVAALIGYSLRKWRGAAIAVTASLLPSFLLVMLAGLLFFRFGIRIPAGPGVPLIPLMVAALFLNSAWRIGRQAVRSSRGLAVALLAFWAVLQGYSVFWVLWICGTIGLFWHGYKRLRW